MKNSQRGFVAPLLLAIIAILAIGAGTYFYLSEKVEISPTIVSSNDFTPVTNSSANTGNASSKTASYIAPFEKELTRCQSIYGKASFCDINTGYINVIKNCAQFKGKENEDRLKTCLITFLIPNNSYVENSSTLSTFAEVNNDAGSYDLICYATNTELSAKDYINKNYILLYKNNIPSSSNTACFADLQKERVHLCKDVNISKFTSCINGINKYGEYIFPNKEMTAAINSLDALWK